MSRIYCFPFVSLCFHSVSFSIVIRPCESACLQAPHNLLRRYKSPHDCCSQDHVFVFLLSYLLKVHLKQSYLLFSSSKLMSCLIVTSKFNLLSYLMCFTQEIYYTSGITRAHYLPFPMFCISRSRIPIAVPRAAPASGTPFPFLYFLSFC